MIDQRQGMKKGKSVLLSALSVAALLVFFAATHIDSKKTDREALSNAYQGFVSLNPPKHILSKLESDYRALQESDKAGAIKYRFIRLDYKKCNLDSS